MSAGNDEEELTSYQRKKVEKNRQKALALRKERSLAHPYKQTDIVAIDSSKKTVSIAGVQYKDTGGGFLLEDRPTIDNDKEKTINCTDQSPAIEADRMQCIECSRPFDASWLYDNFNYTACDDCKDCDEKHQLITKTEAMKQYLLKVCDLESREPPLKYIQRRNPHHANWGDMKLYLQLQVEERALVVWGSQEQLEKELELREEKRVMTKSKKYHKDMKALRMNVRSSLYDRTSGASHTHEFGPETYNESDDTYTHTCLTCDYNETFEKM